MIAEMNSDFYFYFEFFLSSFISVWVFFIDSFSLLNSMSVS